MAIIIWGVIAIASFVGSDVARTKAVKRFGGWMELFWVIVLVVAFGIGAVSIARLVAAIVIEAG